MKWLILVLVLLFLLFIIICISKLTIYIIINNQKEHDYIKIKLSMWSGLIRYNVKLPNLQFDEESNQVVVKEERQAKAGEESTSASSKESETKISKEDAKKSIFNVKEIMQHVVHLQKIVRKFLKRIEITKLIWHSDIGVGDAASTGKMIGLGWSLKGFLVGLLSQFLSLKTDPDLLITPHFQSKTLQLRLECMLRFRIGYALLMGVRVLKYWKGGRPKLFGRPFRMFKKQDVNETA
ncbi:DUF2953 domain-containing protein [Bacillus sp. HMF5848]|uniref:DUF2953 domain-containing protein n=1 Tax=Bacillus sp. HMF5848 TaxID=2495421 RepID=UPI000F7705B1|nr:DUF2953 domain-containing protein [Bacillus sp. HMF5848]RSK28176.1 DUF2953 domain-containing protein [Bacillus sp. HMF5848]